MKTMEEKIREALSENGYVDLEVEARVIKLFQSELDNVIGEICDYGLDVIESRPDDKDEAYRTGILEMVLHAKSKLKQSK